MDTRSDLDVLFHQCQVHRRFAALVLLILASTSCAAIVAARRFSTPSEHFDFSTLAHEAGVLAGHTRVDVFPSPSRSFQPIPNQRYLAYLPHSGFHNQRIAFENALVLARILNRTLLVPPVRLGNQPIRYVHFDHLHRFLSLSGKDGLVHCSQASQDVALPPECLDFFSFTHVSWQWLVNLSSIEAEQRLVYQSEFRYPWLDPTSVLENDTLVLRDNGTYDYRFVDYGIPPSMQRHKYGSLLPISTLASSDAQILQLGTLFGSSRLHLRNRTNIAIRTRIREHMTLSNPILFEVAEIAKAALGDLYLGAHVRVGDGPFKDFGTRNARLVWYKLVTQSFGINIEGAHALEQRFYPSRQPAPQLGIDVAALRTPHPTLSSLPTHFRPNLTCARALHTSHELLRFNIPIFISTDAPQPQTNPVLDIFLHMFPCTFFLSDVLSTPQANHPFQSLMSASSGLHDLDHLVSSHDGVLLKLFLLPFMDAIVVANARFVAGTASSTFSAYVEDVLWRKVHDWDIVQRG